MPFDSVKFDEQARAENARRSVAEVPTAKLIDAIAARDDVLRDLIAARAVIKDPSNWCKRRYGKDVGPFCAVGAIWHVDAGMAAYKLMQTVTAETRAGFHLSQFNDLPSTTHADVLALYDRAISSRLSELVGE